MLFDKTRLYLKMPSRHRAFTLLLFISLVPISLFFVGACANIVGFGFLNQYSEYILLGLFSLASLSRLKRYICGSDVLLYIAFVLVLFLSPMVYPQSQEFIQDNGVKFAFSVVPFYLIGLAVDYEDLRENFKWIARWGVILQVTFQLLCLAGYVNTYNNNSDLAREQMVFAYGFLFSAMYITKLAFEEQNIMDAILSVVSLFLLFSMGTRGPVVIYLIFLLGMAIVFVKYKRHNLLKKSIVLAILAIVYFYLSPILLGMSIFASSIGLSTRVFDSFLGSEMFDASSSSGRDEIFDKIKLAIDNDSSGFGYGFGGDRLFTDVYAHNFEAEILVSFGIIGGSIILCLLLWLTVKAFWIARKSSSLSFLFLLFCYSIVGLQFSGTWIEKPALFLYIGFCVALIRKSRIKAKNL